MISATIPHEEEPVVRFLSGQGRLSIRGVRVNIAEALDLIPSGDYPVIVDGTETGLERMQNAALDLYRKVAAHPFSDEAVTMLPTLRLAEGRRLESHFHEHLAETGSPFHLSATARASGRGSAKNR